jgi:hypothetical protein
VKISFNRDVVDTFLWAELINDFVMLNFVILRSMIIDGKCVNLKLMDEYIFFAKYFATCASRKKNLNKCIIINISFFKT